MIMAFKYPNLNKTQLIIGFLQLLTCMYILGWLWSIGWGVLVLLVPAGAAKVGAPGVNPQSQSVESIGQFNEFPQLGK